jgi:outer membrane protein assembly factor BamB
MNTRSIVNFVIVGAMLGTALLVGANPARAATGTTDQAVAYQINLAHNGDLSGDALTPPLVKRWSLDLGGNVSYPLIAGGKVFVTAVSPSGSGTTLYALDEATGTGAWSVSLGGSRPFSSAAYDSGQVYALTYDGLLRAFDASSGAQLWSTQLGGQYSFTAPPVASNGVLYTSGAGSGGTLYAVSETSGAVLWTVPVINGDDSSPALSDTGVYVSYACPQVYEFDRTSGAAIWHYNPGCSGGGGRTPVLNGGNLYVRDWASSPPGYVFNGSSGTVLSRFTAGPAPAFVGNTGLFLSGSTLTAQDQTGGATLWSFAGDGFLDTAPIIVNNDVYVGSSTGNLYALDIGTGHQVWSTNVGASILAPNENYVGQPYPGMGAGEGYLVVPASTLVTVYSTSPPVVTATTFSATEGAPFNGIVASFTDNSSGAASDTATITWGDGSTSTGTVTANSSGGYNVTGSHTYAEEGARQVSLTVSSTNGSGTGTGAANVGDAVLSSHGYSTTAVRHTTFTGRVATVVDADLGCAAGDYTATINWGDGTSSTGTVSAGSGACAFDVSGTHSYANVCSYTVSAKVSDAGGSVTTATGTMTVTRR